MTDKESKHTLKCAWKSFEGTFCPEAERLLKAQKEENKKLKQALREIRECLTKNAEKGWVSTSEIDDILQNVGC